MLHRGFIIQKLLFHGSKVTLKFFYFPSDCIFRSPISFKLLNSTLNQLLNLLCPLEIIYRMQICRIGITTSKSH